MTTHDLTIEGHVPAGREKFYQDVPFDMPPGVVRLDVQYAYSEQIASDPQLSGGNTVDIGLFDWRGEEFLNAGFRGWTGSARNEFFVSNTDATPGYLPGPMTPGTWHISLGFYKVSPNGCDYTLTLRFTEGDQTAVSFPALLRLDSPNFLLAPREDHWYRGELHCHTIHSDGDSSPREVIVAAEALGLDFLAITDHNNVTHLAEMAALGAQQIILIPGYEVTTFKGHWNVWNPTTWTDFRILSPDMMERAIRFAVEHGGLLSCNHPRPFGPEWNYEDVEGYHCVEVWNGPWRLMNHVSLAFWERKLADGKRLVAIGGSDMHRLKTPHHAHLGTPTTHIYCPDAPTASSLLAGIRAGHVFLSDAPDGPRLILTTNTAMMGDRLPRPANAMLDFEVYVQGGSGLRLELHDASGCCYSTLIEAVDTIQRVRLPVDQTPYLRAQLVQPDTDELTVRALTNPLYFD